MPIYEFYCPEHHTIYQFFAKTLAQGKVVPKCPENSKHRMRKLVSAFAVTSGGKKGDDVPPGSATEASGGDSTENARMDAAMGAMEKEFAGVDENDPRAMGRMMRKMAEISGEKIDGEMEEVVRKLEEGTDPDTLEERLGGEKPCSMEDPDGPPGGKDALAKEIKEARHRFRVRRLAPARDPKLHDYE